MPTQPNPETHCATCGEVLSTYHHCWRCHWPPMDPKQDAQPVDHAKPKVHAPAIVHARPQDLV